MVFKGPRLQGLRTVEGECSRVISHLLDTENFYPCDTVVQTLNEVALEVLPTDVEVVNLYDVVTGICGSKVSLVPVYGLSPPRGVI